MHHIKSNIRGLYIRNDRRSILLNRCVLLLRVMSRYARATSDRFSAHERPCTTAASNIDKGEKGKGGGGGAQTLCLYLKFQGNNKRELGKQYSLWDELCRRVLIKYG